MLKSIRLEQKQLLSVLFTFLVYGIIFSWDVAALVVISIGFHETSHLFAARQLGLNTNGLFLFPFMGGVAVIEDKYETQKQNAIVALAGPIGGALLAAATLVMFQLTEISFLAEATLIMCFLNLFNLLPLSFLDGGQVINTITYSANRKIGFHFKLYSSVTLFVLLLNLNLILAFLILIFVLPGVIKESDEMKNFEEGNIHLCSEDSLNPPESLSINEMIEVFTAWILTILSLIIIAIEILPNTKLFELVK